MVGRERRACACEAVADASRSASNRLEIFAMSERDLHPWDRLALLAVIAMSLLPLAPFAVGGLGG
jgi:hypothetical protein